MPSPRSLCEKEEVGSGVACSVASLDCLEPSELGPSCQMVACEAGTEGRPSNADWATCKSLCHERRVGEVGLSVP